MVALKFDLPDHLHTKLMRLAEQRRTSVDDVLRESVRTLVEMTANPGGSSKWEWPTVDTGAVKDVPVELWRELANPGGEWIEQAIQEGRLDELRDD